MVVLELMRTVERLSEGGTTEISISSADELTLVQQWCEKTGNTVVSTVMVNGDAGSATISRGHPINPASMLPADRLPGARLWLYTNFNCNLSCDYCCVGSGPKVEKRELGVERIDSLVREAADWGVREVYLTGGEPFLLPNIGEIVKNCVAIMPTTLLTNGMLFRGHGLTQLKSMPREGFALQISIDSAADEIHDSHRGKGSWARAIAGIQVAMAEGFRVRVAATIASTQDLQLDVLHDFFDGLGIPREDQIIRPVAAQGVADDGVLFTRESVVPEVTVTAEGVYWHPVAATDDQALVTTQIEPLAPALNEITRLFNKQWAANAAATSLFVCA